MQIEGEDKICKLVLCGFSCVAFPHLCPCFSLVMCYRQLRQTRLFACLRRAILKQPQSRHNLKVVPETFCQSNFGVTRNMLLCIKRIKSRGFLIIRKIGSFVEARSYSAMYLPLKFEYCAILMLGCVCAALPHLAHRT